MLIILYKLDILGLELLDEKFEQFYAQYDDDKYGLSDDEDYGDDDDDTMAKEHEKYLLDQAVKDFETNFKVNCKMLVYNYVCIKYDHEFVKSFEGEKFYCFRDLMTTAQVLP